MAIRYGTFCPVAKASEVVTAKWTPLILHEMMRGSERFSEIQHGVPLMPRSLFARRLREMERDGLILRVPQPDRRGYLYRLTPAAEELRPLINLLGEWGNRWRVPLIDDGDRNVSHLMWSLRRVFASGSPVGGRRFVFHFDFRNVPRRDHRMRQWWLVLRDGAADLCLTDMGFEVDVTVRADMMTLFRVLHGHASLRQARASGDIELSGNAEPLAVLLDMLALPEPPVPRFMAVPASRGRRAEVKPRAA